MVSSRLRFGEFGLFGIAAIACIAGISLLGVLLYHLSVDVRVETALKAAKRSVETIEITREYYSSTIIPIVRQSDLPIHHNYHDTPHTFPNPATVTKEIAKELSSHGHGAKTAFYSRYPFTNTRNPVQMDPFQKEALSHFEKTGAHEYWTVETHEHGPVLRFASADVMKETCVECHNASPDSPKTDWKVGDVAGATSVTVPLSQEAGVSSSLIDIVQILFVFVGTLLIAMTCCFFAARRAEDGRALVRMARDSESEMREMALTDYLTGLPNRRALEAIVGEGESNESGEAEADSIFLHIDLDNFKTANDTYGHSAGDEILCKVAGILRGLTPEGGFTARVGGDEFVMLVKTGGDETIAKNLIEELLEQINEPIKLGHNIHHIGASIGVASIDWVDPVKALRQADMAMYDAKQTGKNRCHFFESTVNIVKSPNKTSHGGGYSKLKSAV